MQPQKNAESTSIATVLYVPVLHDGYLQFFRRHSEVSKELWIIGVKLAAEFSTLHTEIRAMSPYIVAKMLNTLGIFSKIRVLEAKNIADLKVSKIITVSEDISRKVLEKYFSETEVTVDTVFLRYDESSVNSSAPVSYDYESTDLFDKGIMALAQKEAEKSPDWWRHVGAVLVKDRQVISIAYNKPAISEHMPYVFGNPRDFIKAGTMSHFSDVLHAEKVVFSEALRKGISTEGTDMYVSVFPCPDCAKLIACYGVKRCFFASGHASLDGEKVLKAQGVELVYVPLTPRT